MSFDSYFVVNARKFSWLLFLKSFIFVFFDALIKMNLGLEKSTNIFIKILYHFTVIILDVCGHTEGKLVIVHPKFG